LFNPTGGAAYQDIKLKRDFELLKKWVDTRNQHSHKGHRVRRKYTPREEAFITKAGTVMYQACFSPEENGLKEIVEEIGYAALTPTSKFTFKDKHAWEPSEALLHECSVMLGKMVRYRRTRRERAEVLRKCRPRLRLRKLSQIELSEGTSMKVWRTPLWKGSHRGELEEVDYYSTSVATLGEVEKKAYSLEA
jgi:hypothetical protein